MSDFKSKLPDLKELSSMTSKLYKGIKSSVQEIIQDYKDKRAAEETEIKPTEEQKTPEKVEGKAKAPAAAPKEEPAAKAKESKSDEES